MSKLINQIVPCVIALLFVVTRLCNTNCKTYVEDKKKNYIVTDFISRRNFETNLVELTYLITVSVYNELNLTLNKVRMMILTLSRKAKAKEKLITFSKIDILRYTIIKI